jgi:hypothetical protein
MILTPTDCDVNFESKKNRNIVFWEFFLSRKTEFPPAPMNTLLMYSAILWIGFLAHSLIAQENQAKDYTKGFDKFLQLGLPDVKNADYVNLKVEMGFSRIRDFMSFDRDFQGVKLSGNAWLLSTRPDGKHVFLKGGCSTVAMDLSNNNTSMGGTWKPADLDKDIKSLLEYLQKPKVGKNSNRHELESGGWGNVFLTAIHFSRKGYAKEASQIVDLLFQDAGDSRRVIQQALNRLADTQYAEAYQAFCLSSDWGQFDKSLDGLLTRFPSHWRTRPAVMHLSEQVKNRLKTKAPPILTGEGLTGEDQKLALELAEANGEMHDGMDFSAGLWILGQTPFSDSETTSPLARIRDRKIKAFPLLLALMKDTYLTALSLSSYSHFQSSSGQEIPPTEEEILNMYDQLPRPASRGELARKLLEAIVLSQEELYSTRNQDPEVICRLSRAWYQRNKDKTDAGLFQVFLEGQDSSRKMATLQALLNSTKDSDAKVLEKYFLESKEVPRDLGFVTQYVMKRSGKVGDFVEKYLARVKANPTLLRPKEAGLAESHEKQMREETDRMLAALVDLSSVKTAQAIIDELLASPKKWTPREWQAERNKLMQKLAAGDPQENLAPLLKAALKTEDSFLAAQFLSLVALLPRLKGFVNMGEPQKDSPHRFDIKSAADLWKKLLADKRPIERSPEEGEDEGVDDETMTIGQFTALIFENLNEMSGYYSRQIRPELAVFGNKIFPVYSARAEARLAGKADDQLPPFPSATNVTPERRAKIRADLLAADAESLRGILDALSLEDWLVLPQITSEDERLGAMLKPLAGTVTSIKVKIDDSSVRKQVEDLAGKPFDRKTVESLLEISRNLVKMGVSSKIVVKRSGWLEGVRMFVLKWPPPGQESTHDNMESGKNAMINGSIYAKADNEDLAAYARWLTEAPATAKPAQPAAGKTAETFKGGNVLNEDVLEQNADAGFQGDHLRSQQTDFWNKVDFLFKPEFGPCDSYNISFMSNLPATQ